MSEPNSPNPDAQVLRDVTLQAQPRLLRRPSAAPKLAATPPAAQAPKPSATPNFSPTASNTVSSVSPAATTPAASSTPVPAPEKDEKTVYADAYQEGFNKGAQDGQREGVEAGMRQGMEAAVAQIDKATQQVIQQNNQQTQQQLQRLQTLMQSLHEAAEKHFKSSQDDVLALCFETLCRILGQSAVSLEGVRHHVKQTLESWNGKALLNIHMNPQDLALMEAAPDHAEFMQSLSGHDRPQIQFLPEAEVKFGGCVLRSADGALDARLEMQLQIIKRALLQARAHQDGTP